MSIYQKLSDVREKFHELKLEKTGHNKFAGYKYFELGDFLVPALKLFREHGLLSIVTFNSNTLCQSPDLAVLAIINIEQPGEKIIFTSPMGSAALKGCHEVQNIGAVETYQRRYLYVAALEIVEHDAVDASPGVEEPKSKSVPALVVADTKFSEQDESAIKEIVRIICNCFAENAFDSMMEAYTVLNDNDLKIAVWAQLPSNVRSQIKKLGKQNG